MLRPKLVRHIFRKDRPTNFKLGTQTEQATKTGITDKRRDLQGQRSRSQGHVVRLRVVGPTETPKLVGYSPLIFYLSLLCLYTVYSITVVLSYVDSSQRDVFCAFLATF